MPDWIPPYSFANYVFQGCRFSLISMSRGEHYSLLSTDFSAITNHSCPRYRLMLRRCLATAHPCFGMIPPPRSVPVTSAPPHLPTATPRPLSGAANLSGHSSTPPPPTQTSEFGTMLEIRNVQMLPDGQCRVEAWGTWRFRILERGSLDGYGVARVERIDDLEEDEEVTVRVVESSSDSNAGSSDSQREAVRLTSFSSSPTFSASTPGAGPSTSSQPIGVTPMVSAPTNSGLMSLCHTFLDQLREGTPWVVQHLNNTYVPMPEDPAQFSFWMALVSAFLLYPLPPFAPLIEPRRFLVAAYRRA